MFPQWQNGRIREKKKKQPGKARRSNLPERKIAKRYSRSLTRLRGRDRDRKVIETESRLISRIARIARIAREKSKGGDRWARLRAGRNNTENSDRHFLHPRFHVEKSGDPREVIYERLFAKIVCPPLSRAVYPDATSRWARKGGYSSRLPNRDFTRPIITYRIRSCCVNYPRGDRITVTRGYLCRPSSSPATIFEEKRKYDYEQLPTLPARISCHRTRLHPQLLLSYIANFDSYSSEKSFFDLTSPNFGIYLNRIIVGNRSLHNSYSFS